MKSGKYNGWYWFLSGKEDEELVDEKCGKWMYFFTDQEFAIEICQNAIEANVCCLCKCSDLELQGPTGVICFYLNGDDINRHKRVLAFMLHFGLIQRTKTGRLYNISFKFDNQTRAGEYGADFEGKIKLDQFVDLKTLKWIYPEF